MLYQNRAGVPISRARWRELYGTTDYRVVARTERGGWLVTTSWVGVVTPDDHRTFLVEAWRVTPGGMPKGDAVYEEWFHTERSALRMHERLEAELCGGK